MIYGFKSYMLFNRYPEDISYFARVKDLKSRDYIVELSFTANSDDTNNSYNSNNLDNLLKLEKLEKIFTEFVINKISRIDTLEVFDKPDNVSLAENNNSLQHNKVVGSSYGIAKYIYEEIREHLDILLGVRVIGNAPDIFVYYSDEINTTNKSNKLNEINAATPNFAVDLERGIVIFDSNEEEFNKSRENK